jgi:hypothetical protein
VPYEGPQQASYPQKGNIRLLDFSVGDHVERSRSDFQNHFRLVILFLVSTAICGFDQGCQMVSFQTKYSQYGYILEDLGMENVVIYSGRLAYFTTNGYILWAFGNFVVIWYFFRRFGILYQEQSGNPGFELMVQLGPDCLPSFVSAALKFLPPRKKN